MQLKPVGEQVVVLMGASSGIGRQTALRFAERGALSTALPERHTPLSVLCTGVRLGRSAGTSTGATYLRDAVRSP
jgi:NAD(P)-dependent dehydrogenase (short-subunit alcohol dehydrogenase family)